MILDGQGPHSLINIPVEMGPKPRRIIVSLCARLDPAFIGAAWCNPLPLGTFNIPVYHIYRIFQVVNEAVHGRTHFFSPLLQSLGMGSGRRPASRGT